MKDFVCVVLFAVICWLRMIVNLAFNSLQGAIPLLVIENLSVDNSPITQKIKMAR